MTKTIEVALYQFDELEGTAKERAIQYHNEHFMCHDWWDSTYDYMKEEGEHKHGFRIDDIRFSGFYSQGDGASWSGSVDIADWIASKPTEYQQQATTQIILALIDGGWVDEQVLVSFSSSHYCHENTMDVVDIGFTEPMGDATLECGMLKGASVEELLNIVCCDEGALYDMNKELEEDCKSFAREIYRALEDDYDGQTTEEAIAESYACNDVWFDAAGRIAQH